MHISLNANLCGTTIKKSSNLPNIRKNVGESQHCCRGRMDYGCCCCRFFVFLFEKGIYKCVSYPKGNTVIQERRKQHYNSIIHTYILNPRQTPF